MDEHRKLVNLFRFDLLKQDPSSWQELTPHQIPGQDKEKDFFNHGSRIEFEGLVRRFNQGKEVENLFYEGFEPMVIKEGSAILEEICESYPLLSVSAFHRLGLLQLGEVAVRVVAFSRHRQSGFEAVQEIMIQIKRRLPIWKKEKYRDGSSQWVHCQHQFDEKG